MAFTPTTWNPGDKGAGCTLSNGNRTAQANMNASVRSVAGVRAGKWYWEITVVNLYGAPIVGVAANAAATTSYPGSDGYGWGFHPYSGGAVKYHNGASSGYGTAVSVGDVIGVALDMDAGSIKFFVNGADQGVAYSGLSGVVYAMFGGASSGPTETVTANFGQVEFAHTPPAGYNAGLGLDTVDPFMSDVVLLAYCDGADGSTTFTDESPTPKTLAPSGSAALDTGARKFGGASAEFGGGYLTVGTPGAFNFGVADFTVEMWAKLSTTAMSSGVVFHVGAYGSDTGMLLQFATSGSDTIISLGTISPYASIVASYTVATSVLTAGFFHLAAVRANGVGSLYLNGARVGSGGMGLDISAPTRVRVGAMNDHTGPDDIIGAYAYLGWVDDLRVTKGVARYIGESFTPPGSLADASTVYYVAGTVRDSNNIPAARLVGVFRRSPFTLVGTATSDEGTGAYYIQVPTGEEHVLIAVPETGENLNCLIKDRVLPATA